MEKNSLFILILPGILQSKTWVLTGLIMLIRHGDRGPLQHVRNISAVNCGAEENEKISAYKVNVKLQHVLALLQSTGCIQL